MLGFQDINLVGSTNIQSIAGSNMSSGNRPRSQASVWRVLSASLAPSQAPSTWETRYQRHAEDFILPPQVLSVRDHRYEQRNPTFLLQAKKQESTDGYHLLGSSYPLLLPEDMAKLAPGCEHQVNRAIFLAVMSAPSTRPAQAGLPMLGRAAEKRGMISSHETLLM